MFAVSGFPFTSVKELEDAIKHAFDHVDTDNSGSISAEELTNALTELGLSDFLTQDIKDYLAHVDTNSDGEIRLDGNHMMLYYTYRIFPNVIRTVIVTAPPPFFEKKPYKSQ